MSESRLIRRTAVNSFALMLFLGCALFGATAAQAATCKAGTCNQKDPSSYGCGDDSTTLDSIAGTFYRRIDSSYPYYVVQDDTMSLRYSQTCQAVWMRTPGYSTTSLAYFRIDSCNTGCDSKISRVFFAYNGGNDGIMWSTMVPYHSTLDHTHLCVKNKYETTDTGAITYGGERCTAWHIL